MKTRSRTPRAAFTLAELLAVIAIIAILAALLFPVFSGATAKGNTARCMNRLRQWGAALNLYLSEPAVSGTFPSQGSTTPMGGTMVANPQPGQTSNAWFNVLPPYVGHEAITTLWINARMPRPRDKKSFFVCPAAPTTPAPPAGDPVMYYCSYSLNLWVEAKNRGCGGAGATGFSQFLRHSQLRNPSVFAVFADNPPGVGANGVNGYRFAHTHALYMGYPSVGDAFRHDGGANICFADGHVATFQKNLIYTNGMTDYWNLGGIQWNPDNPNLYGGCP